MPEVTMLKAFFFCPLYSPQVHLAHVNEGYRYHILWEEWLDDWKKTWESMQEEES